MHVDILFLVQTFNINPGAVVGLEQTVIRVIEEETGGVKLCVNVTFPIIDCPIEFPFEVRLSTSDGTAGNYISLYFAHFKTANYS